VLLVRRPGGTLDDKEDALEPTSEVSSRAQLRDDGE
jgi:hypothetical protein